MPSLSQDRCAVFEKQRKLWIAMDKAGPVAESASRKPWAEDEAELQSLWAKGLEVIEIAESLGRSKASVSLHVGRHRERLGLASRKKGRPRRRGTSKRLAEALGIREQMVSDYARGRATPPEELLATMNGILGTKMRATAKHTTLRRRGMDAITIPHKAGS